jgi:hypothetical protein
LVIEAYCKTFGQFGLDCAEVSPNGRASGSTRAGQGQGRLKIALDPL